MTEAGGILYKIKCVKLVLMYIVSFLSVNFGTDSFNFQRTKL